VSYVSQNGKGGGNPPQVPTKEELEKAGIKIAVALPLERNINDAAFLHFWAIAMHGWPLFARTYGRTDLNRNEFGKTLLESEYTHVMMLDTDHLHSPNIVEQHAKWLIEDPNKLVIGGMHFRRGEPFDPCAFLRSKDGKLYAPVEWPKGLMKVDAIGHGTILISRKVFETIKPPWWAYTYDADNWKFPSEDLYFSHLCNVAKIDLWCDTTITSPHLIQSSVDENAFRLYLEDHPHLVAEQNYEAPKNGDRKKIARFGKELVR
jgi:hypothetical protein